jgi:glycosyltransferase involved in cell wall biosynthesis
MVNVVLPVLNEARALPWVLARMPERYAPIVVDNGSADDSADIAEDLGALVRPLASSPSCTRSFPHSSKRTPQ